MRTVVYRPGRCQTAESIGQAVMTQMAALGIQAAPLVLTFVGAGGKTTLLYALAQELAGQGKTVLVVTTTHLYEPAHYGVFCADADILAAALQKNKLVIAGCRNGKGKITFIGQEVYRRICPYADVVLVEGDGAKRHPFKICNATEPVIPDNTNLVFAVAGLTALGRPVGEVCFRYELAGMAAQTILTAERAAGLWAQYYLQPLCQQGYAVLPVLHQADTDARRQEGIRLFASLGISYGLVTTRLES